MGTVAPRSKFSAFRDRRLKNPAVKAAYDDARLRSGIVDALIRRRRLLGLTQTDVARSMGVGQPTVSGFETEGSDPRLSTLQRYARSVNASLWVHVQPNHATGQRVEFYFPKNGGLAFEPAEHSEVTERAATWAHTRRPYHRHLSAVPDALTA